MRAGNRSEHTIASYLESPRQAEAYLAGRGRNLVMLDTGARRVELADVQLGDLAWTWTSGFFSAEAAVSVPCAISRSYLGLAAAETQARYGPCIITRSPRPLPGFLV